MDRVGDGNATFTILIFSVGDRKHALPLTVVEKIEFASDVTPFPEAPNVFIGAINWKGQILPVLSMRRRLRLAERALRSTDRFIIIQSPKRKLALLVDSVIGLEQADTADFISVDTNSGTPGCVAAAACRQDEVLLIYDPELFLSASEEEIMAAI